MQKTKRGFTLVELLIVIAVIAILAAAALVAIDPATRINEAQNSERWSAVNALMDAFLQSTVDNDGSYPSTITPDDDVTYMIATSTAACSVSGCTDPVTDCLNFDELSTAGYIASLPIDPDGATNYGLAQGGTGYTINVAENGIVTVASCGAEEEETIEVSR